jgi:hypothetical protein
MRLVCVPSLFFLIISVIAIQITHAVEFIDTNSLEQQEYQQSSSDESNIDDTSLFRGVENAIDEETEGGDAYRIFKSLQDVTEDDYIEEDENIIEHSSSKAIKSRIQPEEEEDQEEEDGDDMVDTMDDEEEDSKEEDDDEEDEEEDFSTDTFPEFKNEATADFFEHLPQTPITNDDPIEEEDEIEEDNIENHIDTHEYDSMSNDEDEEEDDTTSNSNNIPIITPPPIIQLNDNNEENTIPWHRPDSKDNLVANDYDNRFNQESNHNSSTYQNNHKKSTGFRFWHGVFIFSILVIIVKSSNKKKVTIMFKYFYKMIISSNIF